MPTDLTKFKMALVVPCYNEAQTIQRVIRDFQNAVPGMVCHVFDNNSSDNTSAIAKESGAIVHQVSLQGKGNVVRRMFADVEADIYVMVDGDATYDASIAPALIETLINGSLDMVIGSRVTDAIEAYRPGHRWGNKVLTGVVALIFGRAFQDMLSGYRVFSRRYVKSFPAHARGFETETELAIHALELRMPVAEVNTNYGARPEGSASKLNTYRDGLRILLAIFKLFKIEKPLAFFSIGFAICLVLGVVLAIPVLSTFMETGLVPRLPTAILSSALVLLGFLFLICGLVLETVTLGRIEAKRFAYLSVPANHWAHTES